MEEILTIFTSTDKEDIKNSIKQVIIKQVESDLQELGEYLICPSDIRDMIAEMLEDIKFDIEKEVTHNLKTVLSNLIEAQIIESFKMK